MANRCFRRLKTSVKMSERFQLRALGGFFYRFIDSAIRILEVPQGEDKFDQIYIYIYLISLYIYTHIYIPYINPMFILDYTHIYLYIYFGFSGRKY